MDLDLAAPNPDAQDLRFQQATSQPCPVLDSSDDSYEFLQGGLR
jgi:hypothetical protein